MLEMILRLIFPPQCIFCSKILPVKSDIFICKLCFDKIPFLKQSPFKDGTNLFISSYCDEIVCACEYSGKIKESLIRYKFYNKPSYHRALAQILSMYVEKVTKCRKIDIIVSVPLFKHKENKRGFNQARLISKALSKKVGIPERSYLISRIRETGSQSLLGRAARQTNLKDAFRVTDSARVQGKSILLVDDILTTGSTLDECAKTLKKAGAREVIGAVIATGRKY